MASRDIIDIFEECSRRMAAGQSMDDCLRMYPEYAARLRPLLETQQRLSRVQIAPAEIQVDAAMVWQRIEQELTHQPARPRGTYPRLLLVAVLLLALISIAAVFVAWWNQPSNTMFITPLEESVTPTVTYTMTATPSVTTSPTLTPTVSPTLTATSSLTPTTTVTLTPSSTSSMTPTPTTSPTATTTPVPTLTLTLSPTFAPGCGAPLTAEDAINRVLEVYPNTTVTSVRQMIKFGDTLVWEVLTSHGIEVNIDVACGYILTIERENAATPTTSSNQNNAVSPDGFAPPDTNTDANDAGGESNDNVDDFGNSNDNDDDDDDRSNSNIDDDDDD